MHRSDSLSDRYQFQILLTDLDSISFFLFRPRTKKGKHKVYWKFLEWSGVFEYNRKWRNHNIIPYICIHTFIPKRYATYAKRKVHQSTLKIVLMQLFWSTVNRSGKNHPVLILVLVRSVHNLFFFIFFVLYIFFNDQQTIWHLLDVPDS